MKDNKMMKHLGLLTVAAILGCSAASAHSGATGIVKIRMDAMKSVADDMKILGQMVKGGRVFDASIAGQSAINISNHAKEIPNQFPENTTQMPSEASPAIWSKWDEFTALAKTMTDSADNLTQAVQTAQSAADIRPAFGALGKTCSDCHETFRLKR